MPKTGTAAEPWRSLGTGDRPRLSSYLRTQVRENRLRSSCVGRVAHSEALRPPGCRTLASRVRVLTFLPDRLQILFPIRPLTDGVDSHWRFFSFLFECPFFNRRKCAMGAI